MAVWTSELNNQSDSLPTLSQWVKTVSNECAESTRIVKLIWIPNLYENFSLDTEAYRFRVSPSHPLFEVVEENLEEWVETGVVVALSAEKSKILRVSLLTLDGETCDWDALGSNGWKAGPVRKTPKNVTAKTSVKRSKKNEAAP